MTHDSRISDLEHETRLKIVNDLNAKIEALTKVATNAAEENERLKSQLQKAKEVTNVMAKAMEQCRPFQIGNELDRIIDPAIKAFRDYLTEKGSS